MKKTWIIADAFLIGTMYMCLQYLAVHTDAVLLSRKHCPAGNAPKIFHCPGADFSLVTYNVTKDSNTYRRTICVNLKRICDSRNDTNVFLTNGLTYTSPDLPDSTANECDIPASLCDSRCSTSQSAVPICCPNTNGLLPSRLRCASFDPARLATTPRGQDVAL